MLAEAEGEMTTFLSLSALVSQRMTVPASHCSCENENEIGTVKNVM